ncbi:MAG: elongation factor G [Clostridiales bacterium]|nr:elongation factor G [Clostridiales bacterium]MCF8021988.1 elongation factor G [Clostridiales bacterium]
MKNYENTAIRNIAVMAHGGAGKTSLVESMLYNTEAISRIGTVEDGTTTSDYHPEEIEKQITIHTSLVPWEWKETKVNCMDTPGYSDFIGEVKGAVEVADTALFVLSAVDGVEVQTEILWDYCKNSQHPRIIFINKMDRENANFYSVLDNIKEKLNIIPAPLQIPIGSAQDFSGIVDLLNNKAYEYDNNGTLQEIDIPAEIKDTFNEYQEKLIEAAAESDDELLMKYLEGEELTSEEIKKGLKKGVAESKVFPVMCGSATRNMGVINLMNFIVEYTPYPSAGDTDSFSSLVFKTLADPYVGRMNFIRIFSGKLDSSVNLYNNTKSQNEKLAQIHYVRGKTSIQTQEVPTGDIAVLVKLQNTGTGDALSSKDNPVQYDPISFPKPNYTVAILPKTKGDEDKLGNAMSKIMEEEQSLKIEKNTETKETLLTAMGDVHLDIIVNKLKKRYGVDVDVKTPKVPYRETIRSEVSVEGKHKKQSGGHGQFGHVHIQFYPADKDFDFQEKIFGGAVPKQYIPAVEKGLQEAMTEGVLAGYPVTGLGAKLYDGSYHPVDSSEMAFKVAASLAYKKGMEKANPILLEPIMEVEVSVPESYMGDIISDFNGKRGKVLGMDPSGDKTTVKALVPLSEMYNYAIDLKAITRGRGSFIMNFNSYEEVPGQLAEKIIQEAKKEKEA